MAKMTAVDAAVLVLEREGVDIAFGLPGAAINPFYAAMRKRGSIRHVLARHVEGASHMADGYSRAKAGNIGVCIGTSGPAGTDMITGLYAASADSIPMLCITGQAPRARLYKEDFQAVDIESIAKPVTKWACTVREPALVPRVFQQAFHVMKSGRPGPVLIDLPIDVQMAEIEFDIDTYEPLPVYKPAATMTQARKALEMLNSAERPLIVAGGGIINADASELLVELAELTGVPVIPTLMGWGTIPDDHPLMAGMVGLQTSHRYGNATLLKSDFVFGIGNRWANRHTGSVEVYTKGRKFVHVDIEPTQIGRVFGPDLGIVSDARIALELFIQAAKELKAAGKLQNRSAWAEECQHRKATMLRRSHFDNVPLKPQRVYQEMNECLDADTCYVTTIGLSQIAGAQFLKVQKPRNWINCGQAGPLGWTLPAALGVRAADPNRKIVALSGDYDFQFMIEELAVGAQHKLPYLHVVVNNSYLGLIRQAQRGFQNVWMPYPKNLPGATACARRAEPAVSPKSLRMLCSRMLIRQLSYFVTLAKERHFARAADACCITQPTLSAAIRKLEEDLGMPLVQRGHRFVGLTTEGEKVLSWSQQILADYQSLRADLAGERQGMTGDLRIGVIPAAMPAVSFITARFCEANPGATITIRAMTSRAIAEGLDAFELDGGITYLENEPIDHVYRAPLYREQYKLAVPKSHPLAAKTEVSWLDASSEKLILLSQDMQNRRIIDRLTDTLGFAIHPTVVSNSFLAVCAHLRHGDWASIVPHSFFHAMAQPPDLVVLDLVEPVHSEMIGLVISDREPRSPMAAALLTAAMQTDIEQSFARQ